MYTYHRLSPFKAPEAIVYGLIRITNELVMCLFILNWSRIQ